MTRSPRFATTIALPLLVLAGCAAAAPAIAPVAAAPATAAGKSATAPLTPSELAFVERVGAVSPALAQRPEQAVGRGESICFGLRNDSPADKLAADAAERFGGDGVELSDADATKIVDAARETLCAAG
ncbi:DUF732 domain-containing protein [Pseudonocardia lacus]|uniref:DUF732 domain-containing protein n=1 Tax=Pseudonocardia lacus TaxID=2835865 RepID=UPI001BDBF7F8|nr:DUF732 domain-containing protein [Pseudonocardia lacus]